ncbi:MAG: SUMF1/EgtB/PvdO family nonheme iron enzyme [Treponema sp.]|jgi:formylglycine-generating enzyme required for sulfatase activity|nr:SUMF1/EgtB/PvdO family nonheme iron enzyme [Treponema sp.]
MFGKNLEILPEDRVRLPAVLGLKPGRYLAVIYGLVVLGILFLILCYPGLSKPGTLVSFRSEPSGAAIRIDGVTRGFTPREIFVPRGSHEVEFVLPGFEAVRRHLDAGGRLFGSLFVPRRITLEGTLRTGDPAAVLARSALEYIRWSAAGEPTEKNQAPLSLSEGAYRAGPAARDPSVRRTLRNLTAASLRYASNGAALRDLIRAAFFVDNGGQSPSPLGLLSLAGDVETLLSYEGAEVSPWLAERFPAGAERYAERLGELAGPAGGPEWIWSEPDLPVPPDPRAPPSLTLKGVSFTAVTAPGGQFPAGPGKVIPPPSFMIARSPVSLEAWEAFVRENPSWAAANRDALVKAGLAGEEYLQPVEHPAYPAPAASGISWHAAAAYCRWLGAGLPPALAGWEVRLPAETEWEAARPLLDRETDTDSGRLWEWCADFWTPPGTPPGLPLEVSLGSSAAAAETRRLLETAAEAAREAGDLFAVPERSVRGGSWANPPGSAGPESRGSLPPETGSPFVGFRPVIVPPRWGGP